MEIADNYIKHPLSTSIRAALEQVVRRRIHENSRSGLHSDLTSLGIELRRESRDKGVLRRGYYSPSDQLEVEVFFEDDGNLLGVEVADVSVNW